MVVTKNRPVFLPDVSAAVRLGLLALFDVGMIWLIARLVSDGNYPLTGVLSIIVVFMTVCFTLERLKPYRWLAVGLSLAILFVLYPIFYTFYMSTTNTGFGHILTKQQAIEALEREQYVPENGTTFK